MHSTFLHGCAILRTYHLGIYGGFLPSALQVSRSIIAGAAAFRWPGRTCWDNRATVPQAGAGHYASFSGVSAHTMPDVGVCPASIQVCRCALRQRVDICLWQLCRATLALAVCWFAQRRDAAAGLVSSRLARHGLNSAAVAALSPLACVWRYSAAVISPYVGCYWLTL